MRYPVPEKKTVAAASVGAGGSYAGRYPLAIILYS
jgi:hypothetical protein